MKFFLDIDGVMVHANPQKSVEMEEDGFYKFNSISIKVLNKAIFNETDEVILTTTHRFRFSITQWQEIFKSRGMIIKNLSIIDLPVDNKNSRMDEIVKWININSISADEIVIIDDDKSLNGLPSHLKERLVLTNPYTGLNNGDDLYRLTIFST